MWLTDVFRFGNLKIVIIVCYHVTMIAFMFDLCIRLAAFVALAVAFFRKPAAGLRVRNRPCGSVVAPPCCLPEGPRGREDVVPARRAGDLPQAIDCNRNYRQNQADFDAETKILPDLRERDPPPRSEHAEAVMPRRARRRAPRNRERRACCGPARDGGRAGRTSWSRSGVRAQPRASVAEVMHIAEPSPNDRKPEWPNRGPSRSISITRASTPIWRRISTMIWSATFRFASIGSPTSSTSRAFSARRGSTTAAGCSRKSATRINGAGSATAIWIAAGRRESVAS